MRLPPLLALLLLTACVCPDVGQIGEMPGYDLATPVRAFEYFKEAFIRGAVVEAYGDQEYACLSERLRKERGIGRGEYYFVRGDVRRLLVEKIGALESVRPAGGPRFLAADVAELDVTNGSVTATVVLIRENATDLFLRDRRESAFNSPRTPADAVAVQGRFATAVVDAGDLVSERGVFTPDDVYEIRYRSCWRFYDLKGTQIGADIGRELERRRAQARAAESKPSTP